MSQDSKAFNLREIVEVRHDESANEELQQRRAAIEEEIVAFPNAVVRQKRTSTLRGKDCKIAKDGWNVAFVAEGGTITQSTARGLVLMDVEGAGPFLQTSNGPITTTPRA